MEKLKLGFAVTGSFCTFEKVIKALGELTDQYDITPIMSFSSYACDTRFGAAETFRKTVEGLCGKKIIADIPAAEPIGPKKLFDVLVIAPCTGNTLAKIANGIADTPVTMAVKSHIRNEKPVVLAISTNDALAGNAKNIGELLNRRNFYFVPFGQDNPTGKPRSAVADMEKISAAVEAAVNGKQIQPILL